MFKCTNITKILFCKIRNDIMRTKTTIREYIKLPMSLSISKMTRNPPRVIDKYINFKYKNFLFLMSNCQGLQIVIGYCVISKYTSCSPVRNTIVNVSSFLVVKCLLTSSEKHSQINHANLHLIDLV